MISSTINALETEIAFIQKVFIENNDYPSQLVKRIIENERHVNKENNREKDLNDTKVDTQENPKTEVKTSTISLNLP